MHAFHFPFIHHYRILMQISRPSSRRYIRFYEQMSRRLVYSFDVTSSSATYPAAGSGGRVLTFRISHSFSTGLAHYILIDSGMQFEVGNIELATRGICIIAWLSGIITAIWPRVCIIAIMDIAHCRSCCWDHVLQSRINCCHQYIILDFHNRYTVYVIILSTLIFHEKILKP